MFHIPKARRGMWFSILLCNESIYQLKVYQNDQSIFSFPFFQFFSFSVGSGLAQSFHIVQLIGDRLSRMPNVQLDAHMCIIAVPSLIAQFSRWAGDSRGDGWLGLRKKCALAAEGMAEDSCFWAVETPTCERLAERVSKAW